MTDTKSAGYKPCAHRGCVHDVTMTAEYCIYHRGWYDALKMGPPCTQCGQRTPVCAECGDSIIFVPKQGWGNSGEWRHREPPKTSTGPHMPRPKVFVS